ncbi:hypothetical protein ZIOFF_054781 [Zingiber officinale]|uniref:Uncharacterized protein n=1 Tax=Zingiber officinale TaxID=94328 RepID=A0A8J5FEI6_ZINOF|nr:hypothetical protein ZIOFF_054781 [Zingiber officinale]
MATANFTKGGKQRSKSRPWDTNWVAKMEIKCEGLGFGISRMPRQRVIGVSYDGSKEGCEGEERHGSIQTDSDILYSDKKIISPRTTDILPQQPMLKLVFIPLEKGEMRAITAVFDVDGDGASDQAEKQEKRKHSVDCTMAALSSPPFAISLLLPMPIPLVFVLAPWALPPKAMPSVPDLDEAEDLAQLRPHFRTVFHCLRPRRPLHPLAGAVVPRPLHPGQIDAARLPDAHLRRAPPPPSSPSPLPAPGFDFFPLETLAMAVRGFRGVRDDLTELGRHLLDIACLFTPLLPPPHHESPPPSPRPASSPSPPPARASARALAGILSDLAEIGGGFRSGITRLSGALRGPADRDRESGDRAGKSQEIGVSEEVLEYVEDLVKYPDSWLEFPVHLDEVKIPERGSCQDVTVLVLTGIVDSMRVAAKEMSSRQSNNIDSQSLASLASEKCGSIQQEHNNGWQDALMVKTRSQQSIDQWSEVSGAAYASSDATMRLRPDDMSSRGNVDEGNVLVMEKYMDSLLTAEQLLHLPYSLRRKHASASEENLAMYRKVSKLKMSSDEESSDWQPVEDSDFEVLEKSSAERSPVHLYRPT